MPQIYELLGYPISDHSEEAAASRSRAFCPFMNASCDGGGNRYMSEIKLKNLPELQSKFPTLNSVASGICSIQLSPDADPWIVCPHRLLYMGKKADAKALSGATQQKLLAKCGFPKSAKIGIWAEAKVKHSSTNAAASFDYTFDYVLCPLGRISITDAAAATETDETIVKKNLTAAGYTLALANGEIMVEDFPCGKPCIVEIMTSSTSGGNKHKRSCIPQAFEDCVLGKSHTAPGINYRQVWARMASQMIVKSQAAMAWGGSAIWVLQDVLAEYISSSTALDLNRFVSASLSEVNILAFSYSGRYKKPKQGKTIELADSALYAGSIRPYADKADVPPSFQDIVLASVCPPKSALLSSLCKKPMSNIVYT